jgi:DNA-binding response OmpR family regulator
MSHRTIRLAIVDDEEEILKICSIYFDNAGYDIAVFSSGEELLKTLEQGYRPHAVILDVMMPGKSGYEICRILKADRTYKAIKIVIFTALSGDAVRYQSEKAGADAWITKGTDLAGLGDMITRLVS